MMKTFLAAVTMAAMVPSAFATKTVTMAPIVDLNIAAGGRMDAATYVPDGGVVGDDKFLVYTNGSALPPAIYNTAGVQEGNLEPTGVVPTGLGFFGITAGADGVIYGQEHGALDVWQWDSISDTTPLKAYDTPVGLARMGSVKGTGASTVLAFTGSGNNGPVEFFSGSAPFASSEVAPLVAKSGLAISNTGNVAYTVGDTNLLIRKWVKAAGVWTEDTATWVIPAVSGAGPLTYDDVNNVLFSAPMLSTDNANLKVFAYDGTTGEQIGETTFVNALGTVPGYCGAVVIPNGLTGTVGIAARAITTGDSNVVFRKFTYVVTPDASVETWSLY